LSGTKNNCANYRNRSSFHPGHPYNVIAGSKADLSEVIAHYERKNQKIEEARVARMQDGKVVSIYD
jgi:hypothetical protein